MYIHIISSINCVYSFELVALTVYTTGNCTMALITTHHLCYRGYAQGVASRDDLIFSVIYRVSSWNEWLRAGALYGSLTRDAVLAFLGQICALVQQTD